MAYIVAISGSIGVGKSTLLAELQRCHSALTVIEERVEDALFLDRFYADPKTFAFRSKMEFLSLKAQHMLEAARAPGLVVIDRSLSELITFVRLLGKMGLLSDEEQRVYGRLHSALMQTLPNVALHVFLNAPVGVALRRIGNRARPYEAKIDPSYLSALQAEYDLWAASIVPGRLVRIESDVLSPAEEAAIVLKCIELDPDSSAAMSRRVEVAVRAPLSDDRIRSEGEHSDPLRK